MPQKLSTRYVAGRDLAPGTVAEIWELFTRFVERPRPAFERALAGMDEVFLTREARGGALVAFGAARLFTVEWEGRRYGIVYTGWAAIEPRYRGRNLVQKAGVHFTLRCRLRHPRMPLYWLFGASTYRSYLLMRHNFVDFWPHPTRPWPARELQLRRLAMEALADPNWDADAGVVRRFGTQRYRDGVVADDPSVLADPDIRFYAALNPRQAEGDTLICLAELSLRGWLRTAWRMLARASRPRPPLNRNGEEPRHLPNARTPRRNS